MLIAPDKPVVPSPIQALRSGELGSRLLRIAQLAAAVHMADSTLPRKSEAQEQPGEARR